LAAAEPAPPVHHRVQTLALEAILRVYTSSLLTRTERQIAILRKARAPLDKFSESLAFGRDSTLIARLPGMADKLRLLIDEASATMSAPRRRPQGRPGRPEYASLAGLVIELAHQRQITQDAARYQIANQVCSIWEVVTWASLRAVLPDHRQLQALGNDDATYLAATKFFPMPLSAIWWTSGLDPDAIEQLPTLSVAELRTLWGGQIPPVSISSERQHRRRVDAIAERLRVAGREITHRRPRKKLKRKKTRN
jgi:hypothetical protein